MDNRLLKLRSAGMFSNVNETIQHIHLANQGGYRFIIDWSKSCYRDELRSEDPWLYYFEPVWSNLNQNGLELETLPAGVSVACSKNNIITPRLYDGVCDPLLLPKDRQAVHAIIKRHIILNSKVNEVVTTFFDRHLTKPYIGLHIRGPGRLDGGVKTLRAAYGSSNKVPYETYFKQVELALKETPDSLIFACSDSSRVIQTIIDRFGNKVKVYQSTRSDFGEMHAAHPKNKD